MDRKECNKTKGENVENLDLNRLENRTPCIDERKAITDALRSHALLIDW